MPTFIDCIVIYLVSICIFLSMMYNFGLCQKEINYKKKIWKQLSAAVFFTHPAWVDPSDILDDYGDLLTVIMIMYITHLGNALSRCLFYS